MKKTQLIPIALLSVSAVVNAQNASRPPNIILFLVDDMGWEDTSLPFWTQKTHYNEVYETPNMERLARQKGLYSHQKIRGRTGVLSEFLMSERKNINSTKSEAKADMQEKIVDSY